MIKGFIKAFGPIFDDVVLFIVSFTEGVYKGVIFSASAYFILFLVLMTGHPEDFVILFKQLSESSTPLYGVNEFKALSFNIIMCTTLICVVFVFGCLVKNQMKRW
ncbi:hypothetical protein HX37_16665 [Salmonella enterica]|uniref:Uncharacterized protein n=1 Tax=Salmonella enterica TaxID=28901 RepID=A0A5U2F657_SALER|nr:hypothetical protein [Salmonella enterica]EBH8037512.1 hypothetical protein [Salmonella bongori]ECG0831010.1 hypothetical protein [Salmonella enterica subsp. diarizonae]EAP3485602.1 hypothetical protein [Salmonella enterica]EBD6774073.1 hypothetical protein [Salmonella enterica]